MTKEQRNEIARLARTNPAVRALLRRHVQLWLGINDVHDIGMYPKAIVYPDGREVKRTLWQEGHNTAAMLASKLLTQRLR